MRHLRSTFPAFASTLLLSACDGGSGEAPAACQTFATQLTVQDRMSQAATVFGPGSVASG